MRFGTTELVFTALALVGGFWCWHIGGLPLVGAAMGEAGQMLLLVLPQLAAGLLLGGLIGRLVGRERIARALGTGSGLRGLLLASGAGALTPGGPFTSFPLIHALRVAGADAGALMSFLAAWALLGLNRVIVWELPLLGGEFTALRVAACLPLPILVGLSARYLSRSPRLALPERPGE